MSVLATLAAMVVPALMATTASPVSVLMDTMTLHASPRSTSASVILVSMVIVKTKSMGEENKRLITHC